MKAIVAVGFILLLGVLSLIAYQQYEHNQKTTPEKMAKARSSYRRWRPSLKVTPTPPEFGLGREVVAKLIGVRPDGIVVLERPKKYSSKVELISLYRFSKEDQDYLKSTDTGKVYLARSEVSQFIKVIDWMKANAWKTYPGEGQDKLTSDDNQFPVLNDWLLIKGRPGYTADDPMRQRPSTYLSGHRFVVENEGWNEYTMDPQDRWISVSLEERKRDPKVRTYYLDPWGNPYIYRCNKGQDPASWMLNPRSYDLYSFGPNGDDETVLGKELSSDEKDDFTN